MPDEHQPELPGAGNKEAAAAMKDLQRNVIDNVGVSLEAFLGNARITVAELVELKEESVLTLGSTLNEPVELRLNGITVAKGELVAVGDNFAVRLTEISR